jgi:hypothetical protein
MIPRYGRTINAKEEFARPKATMFFGTPHPLMK